MNLKTRSISTAVATVAAILTLVVTAQEARADHLIQFDPGAYTGQYRVASGAYAAGPRSVSLPEGTHWLTFADATSFLFAVDAAGNVSSLNAAAATGTGSTLQFNTVMITVDPAAYTGTYRVQGVDNTLAGGLRTFTVVPGVPNYPLILADAVALRFNVDAAGNLTSHNPDAAKGLGSTLRFETSVLTVDPADYTGTYRVQGVDETVSGGIRTFVVVPALPNYPLILADAVAVRFNVDAAGNVTSHNPDAAKGLGSTLRFETSTVRVVPVDHAVPYYIDGVDVTRLSGERCFVLLPGLPSYRVILQTGQDGRFNVDAAGAPSPTTLTINQSGVLRTFQLSADCGNEPPTADAGSDQPIHAGDTVYLDGSGSFDDQTASVDLLYAWAFVLKPAGSTAALIDGATATPSFVADLPGAYEIELVVGDEEGLPSEPDRVTVSSENVAPTADAGPDQAVHVDEPAHLDGLASFDPDEDALTYRWEIVAAPAGSSATLDDQTSATPILVPDREGSYVVALVVSDAFSDSAPDEVTITAIGPLLAQALLSEACDLIGAMPNASFDAKGHRKSLCNEISRILKFIDRGDLGTAAAHLGGLIERVDGCALRGSPDPKGGGQVHAADHIVDCDDQTAVFDLLAVALDALS